MVATHNCDALKYFVRSNGTTFMTTVPDFSPLEFEINVVHMDVYCFDDASMRNRNVLGGQRSATETTEN